MALFSRKHDSKGDANLWQVGSDGDSSAPTRRLTKPLEQAERLATMLARTRASRVVEVADLLAGMYLSDWERLAEFWNEESREEAEGFLRRLCRISPPRWHFWIEFYDRKRREDAQQPIWRLLDRLRKRPAGDGSVKPSAALEAVFKRAEAIAPFRDPVGDRMVPILTNECVLLCIVRDDDSEISMKLNEFGLDPSKLEREALYPRHEPLA